MTQTTTQDPQPQGVIGAQTDAVDEQLAARLAERLAAEQALLGRLEITRQTVVEVVAGEELPGGDAVVADPDPKAGIGAAVPGVAGQVPVFGQDGDGHRLPVTYRDVVEVVADAGPLRARQGCQAVGVGVESRAEPTAANLKGHQHCDLLAG